MVFVCYALSTVCRLDANGDSLFMTKDNMMPSRLYVWYIINNCLNITWIFLNDRELLVASLIVSSAMWFTMMVPLVISHRTVREKVEQNPILGRTMDVWIIRLLVQNGWGMYCTWIAFEWLLELSIVIIYVAGVEKHTSCTLVLGILCVELIIWMGLDLTVFLKYTAYLYSPYIVLPFAIGGSLAKNYNAQNENTIITIFLLTVVLVIFGTKLIGVIVKHRLWKAKIACVNPTSDSHQASKNNLYQTSAASGKEFSNIYNPNPSSTSSKVHPAKDSDSPRSGSAMLGRSPMFFQPSTYLTTYKPSTQSLDKSPQLPESQNQSRLRLEDLSGLTSIATDRNDSGTSSPLHEEPILRKTMINLSLEQ